MTATRADHVATMSSTGADAVCEAWRFPIVDAHHDPTSRERSYNYNDVTFVHDARGGGSSSRSPWSAPFGELHLATPLRRVSFLGEATNLRTLTIRVRKGQVHSYLFVVDGRRELDPINPQRARADDGREWSRFFTDAAGSRSS